MSDETDKIMEAISPILCNDMMSWDELADRVLELEDEVYRLKAALEKIQDPIGYLKSITSEGCHLDGQMAVKLSEDPNWLKSVAREALAGTR